MLFYFSNVERQRTFSFSEFFCYDFFHHKNGGRTQFWARPVKFANTTVNFFSFFCNFDHLKSGHVQHKHFSSYSLKILLLFAIVQEAVKPSNSDSPAAATLILFDCNLVALKRSIKLFKY